jgi:uncharacterized protein DUF4837
MKKALFLLLLVIISGVSCDRKKDRAADNSGKINSVSVIIDEQLWNGEIGDTIRNKFASPVTGLPQEEPLFNINQYPVKLLEGYMTNSRNIILVKKEPKTHFEITQNEFTTPQNVVHISGKTNAEIIALIEENTALIIEKMRATEIAENQDQIRKSLLDDQKIVRRFKVSFDIPQSYRYVVEKRRFLWLKKEITSGNTSILIYEVPLRSITKNTDLINNIIRMRDSIGNLYIHGTERGTRMITENSYTPYLVNISINDRKAIETRGTWELNNDFMSGPFLNYCILDKANNRILVLEGFCYAPSKEKRDLMMEMEAIMKSVKFLKRKK